MQDLSVPLKRGVKALAAAFGVSISRASAARSTKHADQALRQLRRWSANDIVFDVGANDGRTILRLQDLLARRRIFAFEPVSSTYRTLVQRTAHLSNVRTFQVALGAALGRHGIYVHEETATNSFCRDWAPTWTGLEQVEVSTVDRVMEEQGLDFIHFLKIDTEGFEMEVLKGAEAALRESRIAIVQVEVGTYQIARPFTPLETVRQYLGPFGYLLYGVYNQCTTCAVPPAGWPAAERAAFHAAALAYCDAVFIRADA